MLPSPNCDIPETACCDQVFGMANSILAFIYADLITCFAEQDCQKPVLAQYITFPGGDDAITDALTVAMIDTRPTPGTQTGAGGTQLVVGLWRSRFEIRLRESGWPMAQVSNREILLPDPSLQTKLALHAYAHGERLFRSAISLVAKLGTGKAQFATDAGPTRATVESMQSLPVLGGVIGWNVVMSVDMRFTGPLQ